MFSSRSHTQFAKLYTWDDFLKIGSDLPDVDARIDACQPGSCATLIYTSGTTVIERSGFNARASRKV